MKKEDHAQQPSERERLEARVLAMLLGECDADEQTVVEGLLAENPDLQAYRESAERRLDLLGEASRGKVALEEEPLQLDPERRRELEKLLAPEGDFKEDEKITPFEPSPKPAETGGSKWNRFLPFGAGTAVVAGAAAAVVAGVFVIQSSFQKTKPGENMALAEESPIEFQTSPAPQRKRSPQTVKLRQRAIGNRDHAANSLVQPTPSSPRSISEIAMPPLEEIASAKELSEQEELAALDTILDHEVAQILDLRVVEDSDGVNGAFYTGPAIARGNPLARDGREGALEDSSSEVTARLSQRGRASGDYLNFEKRNLGGAGFGRDAARSANGKDAPSDRDASMTLRSKQNAKVSPPVLTGDSLNAVSLALSDSPAPEPKPVLSLPDPQANTLTPAPFGPLATRPSSATIGIGKSAAFKQSDKLAENELAASERKASEANRRLSELREENLDADRFTLRTTAESAESADDLFANASLEKQKSLTLGELDKADALTRTKAETGLEVGFTFREVWLVVEDPGSSARKIGLTKKNIESTVKRKLLNRGLRVVDGEINGSFLNVAVKVEGGAFSLDLAFRKHPDYYYDFTDKYLVASAREKEGRSESSTRGDERLSLPVYNTNLKGGRARHQKIVLQSVDKHLNAFILAYLKSNLKYEQTLGDGKLIGVDKVISLSALREKSGVARSAPKYARWVARHEMLLNTAAPTPSTGSKRVLDMEALRAIEAGHPPVRKK